MKLSELHMTHYIQLSKGLVEDAFTLTLTYAQQNLVKYSASSDCIFKKKKKKWSNIDGKNRVLETMSSSHTFAS